MYGTGRTLETIKLAENNIHKQPDIKPLERKLPKGWTKKKWTPRNIHILYSFSYHDIQLKQPKIPSILLKTCLRRRNDYKGDQYHLFINIYTCLIDLDQIITRISIQTNPFGSDDFQKYETIDMIKGKVREHVFI